MSAKYEKLKTLLKELFQLDQPDLDFGLYRIMHAKSAEVTQFLDKDLLPQVKAELSTYQSADKSGLERELTEAIRQAKSLGVDPETTQKVKDLRFQLDSEGADLDSLENEVYDHLYSFFRRYYSEGDFLAKRVYKAGVYAIPYEGEEVKLHWANKDQYYIKTGEYLRDYAFRLHPENKETAWRVHFRLVDAQEGEHGNLKVAEGKERVFILATSEAYNTANGELFLNFEYRQATMNDWPATERKGKAKPPNQKELIEIAVARFFSTENSEVSSWVKELRLPHRYASGEVAEFSRLEAHLRRYSARHAFDYFIHRDLGQFLRRELAFYLKNEVFSLEDVATAASTRVDQVLSKVRLLKNIAEKLITFLAQLEDFQKVLWTKKKFIYETEYCLSLGKLPEELLKEVLLNKRQLAEWDQLYAISDVKGDLAGVIEFSDPLSGEFLKQHPGLVVDTRHFSQEFKANLLDSLPELDSNIEGLIIHGENSHALRLSKAKFEGKVRAIYIDPPYNTDAGPIAYKNGYRHSSWLSLISERVALARSFLVNDGILCITIDDVEVHNLRCLIEAEHPDLELLGVVPIKNNPAGRTGTVGFSICHEYALFYGASENSKVGRLEHTDAQKARYKERDELGAFEWTNFRKHGGLNTYREARPRQFYPIYVKESTIRIPNLEWDNASRDYRVLNEPRPDEEVLLPIDENGKERIWDFVVETAREELPHLKVRKDSRGLTAIYRKWRINEEGLLPQTWWDKSEYSAAEYGTNLLASLFGEAHKFTFPKSIHAVTDCLRVCGFRLDKSGLALDFFGGSGTTAHAQLSLNRLDGGNRKYILCEMGEYFDAVLLPRIKKAIYSENWRNGKPTVRSSQLLHTFKYIRLESYEDTLNNLEFRRNKGQQSLLDGFDRRKDSVFTEQYFLRYMLEVESRGSPSLLNVQAFRDPTAYKLRVKQPGSDESREVGVDLVETFNWLVGLKVKHIALPESFNAAFERDTEQRLKLKGRLTPAKAGPWWFRKVEGTTPDGRKTLVIWRKLTDDIEQDNLVLDEWFTKQGFSTKDFEFQLIYVNGDNNLENLKAPDDTWKVRLIEEDFHRLMFDTQDA